MDKIKLVYNGTTIDVKLRWNNRDHVLDIFNKATDEIIGYLLCGDIWPICTPDKNGDYIINTKDYIRTSLCHNRIRYNNK
jgi:hypothetical protein